MANNLLRTFLQFSSIIFFVLKQRAGSEQCGDPSIKGVFYEGFTIDLIEGFKIESFSSVFHCDSVCKDIFGCSAISFDKTNGECIFYNKERMRGYAIEKGKSIAIIYTSVYCPTFHTGTWSEWEAVGQWGYNMKNQTCYRRRHRACVGIIPGCENIWGGCEGRNESIVNGGAGDINSINEIEKTGIYCFYLDLKSVPLYCEKDDTGQVWILIQRRVDGSVDFNLGWNDYTNGFGNIDAEFWLGNNYIHHLTKERKYGIRFEMSDGIEDKYADYSLFVVRSPDLKFHLEIYHYSGDAGDSMTTKSHNRMFTTYDNDNDEYTRNCAGIFKGGWWFSNCHGANPNGLYLNGNTSNEGQGIVWYTFRGFYFSLLKMTMKITRND